jgi:hypothetical protein
MPTPMMQQQQQQQQQQAEQKSRRPEMRGPTTDVSDMMSRLKTKTINIQPSGSSNAAPAQEQGNATLQNILSGMTGGGGGGGGSDDISLDSSVINVSSLGDIPQDSTPHRSKRRPRSEKNTVSMDL